MNSPTAAPSVLGFLAVVAFMAIVACGVAYSRLPRALKFMIYAALVLRVVGSWLRYTVLFDFYGGTGDATGYYQRGLEYSEFFVHFDLSPLYDPSLWLRGTWWGTSFVSFPSGVILSLIGPSLLGEFLAFSLLACLGLLGLSVAFARAYPDVPLTRYARWAWLFPSLWFWPSSVGKDAIVLMGLGLAVAGFYAGRGRINWVLLSIGMFFVFAIRPQVAAIVLVALVLAQWLTPIGRWTFGKMVEAMAIAGAGIVGVWVSMQYIGVDGFDVEGVQSYVERMATRTSTGGSEIQSVGIGLSEIPLSLINVLARPFLWEATNAMMLLSALEIIGFWAIVWYRRRALMATLRTWRNDRLLRFAVPFALMYAIALGLTIANLGIVARQRIFLFPFVFLLLEAAPSRSGGESSAARPSSPSLPGDRKHPLTAQAVH